MKKVIKKISKVVQIVLLAPIKVPSKALNIIKYIALGLGILESVIDQQDGDDPDQQEEKGGEDGEPQ